MLVAADIGNSSISVGYFSGKGLFVQTIPTHPLLTEEQYLQLINAFIKENNIEKSGYAGIISSVVSGHTDTLKRALEGLSGPQNPDVLVLSHSLSGIGFKIEHPEKLGTDRIADAVAAFSDAGQPVAVVNFGTATTITVVDNAGDYIGGAIMPGIRLMNEALGLKTSALGRIDMNLPEAALGRDTEACIRSGLFIGTAGAVERIIADIENETGFSFAVILTGGNARFIDPFVRRPHSHSPNLTLEGLKIIYGQNRPQ